VDLAPPGATLSVALATTGAIQAGYARNESPTTPAHAGIWRGNAESWLDLSTLLPPVTESQATCIVQDQTTIYVGGWARAGTARMAVLWTGPVCYANCDASTEPPVLNVNDLVCFQTRFAAADPYANCDGSTTEPVLNVNDFVCFQTRFAAGCP
jgi:hypothetical protein